MKEIESLVSRLKTPNIIWDNPDFIDDEDSWQHSASAVIDGSVKRFFTLTGSNRITQRMREEAVKYFELVSHPMFSGE